ncbi:hypothetical protein J437_LFUL018427 [Ladona fulva]|uniref:CCHC-type domain-containing protein n=1 Tax=Ladona fulva TaxID=123851 RepID=A0A8K0KQP2_LADFU|nr:hypothetical protein J437_LFUL018427 [Ladona fulva]
MTGHVAHFCCSKAFNCFLCAEQGHFARECPLSLCGVCKQSGHRPLNCPSKATLQEKEKGNALSPAEREIEIEVGDVNFPCKDSSGIDLDLGWTINPPRESEGEVGDINSPGKVLDGIDVDSGWTITSLREIEREVGEVNFPSKDPADAHEFLGWTVASLMEIERKRQAMLTPQRKS